MTDTMQSRAAAEPLVVLVETDVGLPAGVTGDELVPTLRTVVVVVEVDDLLDEHAAIDTTAPTISIGMTRARMTRLPRLRRRASLGSPPKHFGSRITSATTPCFGGFSKGAPGPGDGNGRSVARVGRACIWSVESGGALTDL